MPTTSSLLVQDLRLDLTNYRMVEQATELDAVRAMVETRPEYFWALTESLVDDGYLPTENILVLQGSGSTRTVKEGNRRIAALKLILGQFNNSNVDVPDGIATKISVLNSAWKTANSKVPCAIYTAAEKTKLDRIVQLAHGKGDKASRDQWNALARARYNRNEQNGSEPGLDFLESYLKLGKNVNAHQRGLWGGVFPLSVLDEAIKRLAPRCGEKSAPDLANKYPKIKKRENLEAVAHDIGQGLLTFPIIRDPRKDFAVQYGFPPLKSSLIQRTSKTNAPSAGTDRKAKPNAQKTHTSTKQPAISITDPKAVKHALSKLKILGDNRGKVVALRDEACKLNVLNTPMTFCIVLRTMIELSALAYSVDHTGDPLLKRTKKDGRDKPLADFLKEVMQHMITAMPSRNDQTEVRRILHGASAELTRSDSILSVTSMNQIVHDATFSVTPSDVISRFGNILPLLERLNA